MTDTEPLIANLATEVQPHEPCGIQPNIQLPSDLQPYIQQPIIQTKEGETQVRPDPRRFYIHTVFCMQSFSGGLVWNIYSPIAGMILTFIHQSFMPFLICE